MFDMVDQAAQEPGQVGAAVVTGVAQREVSCGPVLSHVLIMPMRHALMPLVARNARSCRRPEDLAGASTTALPASRHDR